jgi:hypothetical protein
MRARAAVLMLLLGGCRFDPAGMAAPDGELDASAPDAAPSVRACTEEADLVACYRFEALPPVDESIHANHATASGVTLVPGVGGSAIAFGDASSALVADSASLDVLQITMEVWVLIDQLPAEPGRAGIVDNNGQYGLFLAPDGGVRCALASATDIGLTLTVGVWTHVACTYDGATIRLYQDGIAGPTVTTANPMVTAGVDGMGLGQNVPSGDHLHGAIDNLRIWRVARTPEQICAAAGC